MLKCQPKAISLALIVVTTVLAIKAVVVQVATLHSWDFWHAGLLVWGVGAIVWWARLSLRKPAPSDDSLEANRWYRQTYPLLVFAILGAIVLRLTSPYFG